MGTVRLPRSLSKPARYASLAAGAVPVLAFPGVDLEYLAWAGLIPGLILMRQAPSGREAAVRGWWFGAGYLLASLYWLIPNIGPGLLLVAVVMAVPLAGLGVVAWQLLRPPVTPLRALAAVVVLPSWWLIPEWIRSWQFLGGPWALFGASQWQHPVVLALAAAGGVWLVTAALVAANTGLTIAVLPGARPAARLAGAAAAAVAIAAGPVAFALAPAPPVTGQAEIALVQPGLSADQASRFAAEAALTRRVRGASLVIWGESSVDWDLNANPAAARRLGRLARQAGTPLLVSQDATSPAGAKSKVAELIGPDGITATYVKTRLVPFGEYIPFRPVLGWLTSISHAATQNMVTGTGARVLSVRLASGQRLEFGVLVCFESAFPDMSRADAGHGARLIIYQTSDATFQDSWAPEQHASLAALRAAETGRPTAQAALTGDSAAFDSRGRLLAWAPTSYRGVLLVRQALPPAGFRTPFDRLGDYVPWVAVCIAALATAALAVRTRGSRPANQSPGPDVLEGAGARADPRQARLR
jgi:apolipoprotein N-acyltransferase